VIIRDGDWTLFESDFLGQRQTWSRQNPDGTTTYRTDYKVDDVMDANLLLRNDTAGEKYGDWRLIASVPLALHHRELAEAQSQMDSGYIDKWLSENDRFKTFR